VGAINSRDAIGVAVKVASKIHWPAGVAQRLIGVKCDRAPEVKERARPEPKAGASPRKSP